MTLNDKIPSEEGASAFPSAEPLEAPDDQTTSEPNTFSGPNTEGLPASNSSTHQLALPPTLSPAHSISSKTKPLSGLPAPPQPSFYPDSSKAIFPALPQPGSLPSSGPLLPGSLLN